MTSEIIAYEPDYPFTSKPRMNAEKSDWAGVINATLSEALAGEENARSWFLDNGEEFQFVCALADVKPAQVSEFAKRRMNGLVFPKPKARLIPAPAFVAALAPIPAPTFVAEPIVAEDAESRRIAKSCESNVARAKRYEFKGRSLTLREWSEDSGVNVNTLKSRLEHGMTIEQAISPVVKKGPAAKTYEFEGKSLTIEQWAAEKGIKPKVLRNRLSSGYSIATALTAERYFKYCAEHPRAKPIAENVPTTVVYQGVQMTIKEAAHRAGFDPKVVYMRIRRGWTIDDALARPLSPVCRPKRAEQRKAIRASEVASDMTTPTSERVCEAVAMSVSNAAAHVKPVVSTLRGYLSRGLKALAEKVAA